MPRPKGKPSKPIRFPESEYANIKRFQKQKGIPTMFEATKLYYLANKDWKKALIKREAQIEAKFKREYDNRLARNIEKYVDLNTDLKTENEKMKEQVDGLGLEKKAMDEENNKLESKIERLKAEADSEIEKVKKEIERLSSDELIGTLTQKNAELQEIVDSQKDYDAIKRENVKMEEQITLLTERLHQFETREEEFNNAEQLLQNYETLKQEASQNPELRKMLNSKATEIKWMKDTIVSELNRIFEMDRILDVKINIEKLINEITKKAKFELEKYQEIF